MFEQRGDKRWDESSHADRQASGTEPFVVVQCMCLRAVVAGKPELACLEQRRMSRRFNLSEPIDLGRLYKLTDTSTVVAGFVKGQLRGKP
jgi:hypothetical protein